MGEGSLFGEATFRQSLEGAGSVLGQAWGRCVSGSGNTQGPWAGSGEARSAGAGKAGEAQGRAGAEGEARQEEGRSWSILQTLFKTVSFILKATGVIRCFFQESYIVWYLFLKRIPLATGGGLPVLGTGSRGWWPRSAKAGSGAALGWRR